MTYSAEELEEFWEGQRAELQRDSVGLWEIIGIVRYERPDLSESEVQDLVLAIIEYGLRRGEAEAGTHVRGVEGLADVWTGEVEGVIARIRREWDALDHDPNPGEVVMLERPR